MLHLVLLVVLSVQFFVAFTLILRKGILKDKRTLLLKKTKKELHSMLNGVKGISRLTKIELVELLVA